MWMAFHPGDLPDISVSRPLLLLIVVLCITPIYPPYKSLGKRGPSSKLASIFLVGGLTSLGVFVVCNWGLHLTGRWVLSVYQLYRGLFLTGSVLFAWNWIREMSKR
jgi:hypothetical protein